MEQPGKRGIDYVVKLVQKDDKQKERWYDIGVAFVNPKSHSISLRTLFGDIVLMEPKKKEEAEYNPFNKGGKAQ